MKIFRVNHLFRQPYLSKNGCSPTQPSGPTWYSLRQLRHIVGDLACLELRRLFVKQVDCKSFMINCGTFIYA